MHGDQQLDFVRQMLAIHPADQNRISPIPHVVLIGDAERWYRRPAARTWASKAPTAATSAVIPLPTGAPVGVTALPADSDREER